MCQYSGQGPGLNVLLLLSGYSRNLHMKVIFKLDKDTGDLGVLKTPIKSANTNVELTVLSAGGCHITCRNAHRHIETSEGRRGPSRPPQLRIAPAAMGYGGGGGGTDFCAAHVVVHLAHVHECRGGLPRMRPSSVVLGMPRNALVCKRGRFSSLSGNLLQKDFQ